MSDFVSIVQKIIAPLHRCVMLMVGRATITLIDDSTPEQTLQVQLLPGMTRDRVRRYQQYGFTSVPLPGSQAVTVAVSGDTDNLIAVASGDGRYRPTNLQPGEVGIYTSEGMAFYAKCTGAVNASGVTPQHFAARADRVDAEINSIWAYLLAHKHPTGTGPSGVPTVITADPGHGSTSADKAMVE